MVDGRRRRCGQLSAAERQPSHGRERGRPRDRAAALNCWLLDADRASAVSAFCRSTVDASERAHAGVTPSAADFCAHTSAAARDTSATPTVRACADGSRRGGVWLDDVCGAAAGVTRCHAPAAVLCGCFARRVRNVSGQRSVPASTARRSALPERAGVRCHAPWVLHAWLWRHRLVGRRSGLRRSRDAAGRRPAGAAPLRRLNDQLSSAASRSRLRCARSCPEA